MITSINHTFDSIVFFFCSITNVSLVSFLPKKQFSVYHLQRLNYSENGWYYYWQTYTQHKKEKSIRYYCHFIVMQSMKMYSALFTYFPLSLSFSLIYICTFSNFLRFLSLHVYQVHSIHI